MTPDDAGRAIKFTVYGEPTAKGRPKFGSGRVYTPAKTMVAEQSFQYQALQYKPSEPLQGPLSLVLRFYRRKGMPKTKKGQEAAISGEMRPITKPDLDNYGKLCLDSMNGLIYTDDAQIVSLTMEKYYSDNPRVEVEICRLQRE